MKKINIAYWIFTILFAAAMLFSAIPNVMNNDDSVALINTLLQYPKYLIPFIGVAKVLGVIGILIPGFPRIKEWAYAGLTFDLIGATYSILAVGPINAGIAFMLVFFGLGAGSYIFYHKKLKAAQLNSSIQRA